MWTYFDDRNMVLFIFEELMLAISVFTESEDKILSGKPLLQYIKRQDVDSIKKIFRHISVASQQRKQ